MAAYIYKIKNNITSQIYIGKTENDVEKRFLRHKSNAAKGMETYLYRSMRKYGLENFSIEVVEETNIEEINKREMYHISENSPELNMTLGGDGGSTTHNRIWVNNGSKNLYILLEDTIPEGYFRGRICKFNDSTFQREMSLRAQPKIDKVYRARRISEGKKGKSHVGVPHTIETKALLSKLAKNRNNQKIQCVHCSKLITSAMYARWHGDKCKYDYKNIY